MTQDKDYKNKRFIAGAVCPECKKMDTIFTFVVESEGESATEGNTNKHAWRACAACDFEESLEQSTRATTEELPTRVNQHRLGEKPLNYETPVEAVKLVDLKGDKNK